MPSQRRSSGTVGAWMWCSLMPAAEVSQRFQRSPSSTISRHSIATWAARCSRCRGYFRDLRWNVRWSLTGGAGWSPFREFRTCVRRRDPNCVVPTQQTEALSWCGSLASRDANRYRPPVHRRDIAAVNTGRPTAASRGSPSAGRGLEDRIARTVGVDLIWGRVIVEPGRGRRVQVLGQARGVLRCRVVPGPHVGRRSVW